MKRGKVGREVWEEDQEKTVNLGDVGGGVERGKERWGQKIERFWGRGPSERHWQKVQRLNKMGWGGRVLTHFGEVPSITFDKGIGNNKGAMIRDEKRGKGARGGSWSAIHLLPNGIALSKFVGHQSTHL